MADDQNALSWAQSPPQFAQPQAFPQQGGPDLSGALSQAWHQSYAKNNPSAYERMTAALHSAVQATGADASGDPTDLALSALRSQPGAALATGIATLGKGLMPTPVASAQLSDAALPEERQAFDDAQKKLKELQNARDANQRNVPKSTFRDSDGNVTRKQDPNQLERINQQYKQDAAPHESQMRDLQSRWSDRQTQKAGAQRPFSETASPEQKAFLANMPGVAGAMGAAGGLISNKPLSYALSGLFGGIEGAGAAFYPTYRDLQLPEGSPAEMAAQGRLRDANFWLTHVAPEAGFGTAAGLVGNYYGGRVRNLLSAAGGAVGKGVSALKAPSSSNALAAPETSGQQMYGRVKDANGRYRYEKGHPLAGRFAHSPED